MIRLGLILAAAIAALFFAYRHGVNVEHSRGQAEIATIRQQYADASRQAFAAYADQLTADIEAARADERRRIADETQTEIVYRTITQRVVEYVESNPDSRACGLDDDGLRIWNDANRGSADAAPAAAGE